MNIPFLDLGSKQASSSSPLDAQDPFRPISPKAKQLFAPANAELKEREDQEYEEEAFSFRIFPLFILLWAEKDLFMHTWIGAINSFLFFLFRELGH